MRLIAWRAVNWLHFAFAPTALCSTSSYLEHHKAHSSACASEAFKRITTENVQDEPYKSKTCARQTIQKDHLNDRRQWKSIAWAHDQWRLPKAGLWLGGGLPPPQGFHLPRDRGPPARAPTASVKLYEKWTLATEPPGRFSTASSPAAGGFAASPKVLLSSWGAPPDPQRSEKYQLASPFTHLTLWFWTAGGPGPPACPRQSQPNPGGPDGPLHPQGSRAPGRASACLDGHAPALTHPRSYRYAPCCGFKPLLILSLVIQRVGLNFSLKKAFTHLKTCALILSVLICLNKLSLKENSVHPPFQTSHFPPNVRGFCGAWKPSSSPTLCSSEHAHHEMQYCQGDIAKWNSIVRTRWYPPTDDWTRRFFPHRPLGFLWH